MSRAGRGGHLTLPLCAWLPHCTGAAQAAEPPSRGQCPPRDGGSCVHHRKVGVSTNPSPPAGCGQPLGAPCLCVPAQRGRPPACRCFKAQFKGHLPRCREKATARPGTHAGWPLSGHRPSSDWHTARSCPLVSLPAHLRGQRHCPGCHLLSGPGRSPLGAGPQLPHLAVSTASLPFQAEDQTRSRSGRLAQVLARSSGSAHVCFLAWGCRGRDSHPRVREPSTPTGAFSLSCGTGPFRGGRASACFPGAGN